MDMSGAEGFSSIVEMRGVEREVEGHVTGCCASRDNRAFAFSTGEGDVLIAPRETFRDVSSWTTLQAHDGPVLALSPDISGAGFLTGGEDCRLTRLSSGRVEELAKLRRWIEHVACWTDGRKGLIAFASGKDVHLRQEDGTTGLRVLTHSSTVSGIAFDTKGKRIATSHYNGASMWFTQSKDGSAKLYEWKGSHIGVILHPGGEALVTAMQENDLHGWRLSDGHNMRMSGYPAKVSSLAFTPNGKWLVTSGADCVVAWPFFGGGPMGKPPKELPGIPGVLCSRVATHPQQDVIAAGFADGTVLMIEHGNERVLPVCKAGGGTVTALAFSADGCTLGYGTEDGRIGMVDLAAPA